MWRKENLVDKITKIILAIITASLVTPILFIILFILVKGYKKGIEWQFWTELPTLGLRGGGILPAILGTIFLLLIATIISFLLGIGTAIYLAEYSKKEGKFYYFLKASIFTLTGIPSIVWGLFGLSVFVILFHFGVSLISGGITLALLMLPLFISVGEEALRNVPISYKEASYALGATHYQMIKHTLLPYALPGIMSGFFLALGRAAGEAAPLLLTAAAFYLPYTLPSLFSPTMSLPTHLYMIATQVPGIKEEYIYGTAFILILWVLLFNLISNIFYLKYKRIY
jgi:phosphate transport system permease protein